jgi:UDP-GlcNAc:undecaprenyl-phosphate GlcNAc-1-phosphate transferase
MGGYRGTWRYFGMMDAVVFAKSVILGTGSAVVVILYVYRFQNYSRSVFVIYAVLAMLLLSSTRGSFRLVGEFILRRRAAGLRCIVYGTSGASLGTIREAFGADAALRVIGYVDDDPRHRNLRVNGYPVVGGYADLLMTIQRGDVDSVVLNTHLIDAERLMELENACDAAAVDLLRLQVNLKRLSAAAS